MVDAVVAAVAVMPVVTNSATQLIDYFQANRDNKSSVKETGEFIKTLRHNVQVLEEKVRTCEGVSGHAIGLVIQALDNANKKMQMLSKQGKLTSLLNAKATRRDIESERKKVVEAFQVVGFIIHLDVTLEGDKRMHNVQERMLELWSTHRIEFRVLWKTWKWKLIPRSLLKNTIEKILDHLEDSSAISQQCSNIRGSDTNNVLPGVQQSTSNLQGQLHVLNETGIVLAENTLKEKPHGYRERIRLWFQGRVGKGKDVMRPAPEDSKLERVRDDISSTSVTPTNPTNIGGLTIVSDGPMVATFPLNPMQDAATGISTPGISRPSSVSQAPTVVNILSDNPVQILSKGPIAATITPFSDRSAGKQPAGVGPPKERFYELTDN